MQAHHHRKTALAVIEEEGSNNDNSDNENNALGTGHVNHIWSGNLPAPKGKVANEFGKILIAEQKCHTKQLLKFIKSEEESLLVLNAETELFTVLVNLPSSDLVW
eukprot:6092898-Ditylum_brightwellii.AAC.1